VIERLRELDQKRGVELVEKAYKEIDRVVDEGLDLGDDNGTEWR